MNGIPILEFFAANETTMPVDRDRNRIAKLMGFSNEQEASAAGAMGMIFARYRFERALEMFTESQRIRNRGSEDRTTLLEARLKAIGLGLSGIQNVLTEAYKKSETLFPAAAEAIETALVRIKDLENKVEASA